MSHACVIQKTRTPHVDANSFVSFCDKNDCLPLETMQFSIAAVSAVALSALGVVDAFATCTLLRAQPCGVELFAQRKPFITGNWKLNPSTKGEAVELASGVASQAVNAAADVAIFVPFPFIESVLKATGNKLHVGAEVSFLQAVYFLLRCRPAVFSGKINS